MIDTSRASLLCDPEHFHPACKGPVRAERGFDEVWIACSGVATVIAWNTGLVADAIGWDEIARLVDVRSGLKGMTMTVGAVRRWAPTWADGRSCEACGAAPRPACKECGGSGRIDGRVRVEALAMGRAVDRDLVARCFAIIDVADEERVQVSWSSEPSDILVFDGEGWRALVGGLSYAVADCSALADLEDSE